MPVGLGTSRAALYCSSLHERLSSWGGTTRMKTLCPNSKEFSFDRVSKLVAEPLGRTRFSPKSWKAPVFAFCLREKCKPTIHWNDLQVQRIRLQVTRSLLLWGLVFKTRWLQMNSMPEYILLAHNLIYNEFKFGCSQGKAKAQTLKRLG